MDHESICERITMLSSNLCSLKTRKGFLTAMATESKRVLLEKFNAEKQ